MTSITPKFWRNRRTKGFSLVEFMVAATVSLLLLGGVLQIYLSSRQTYRALDAQTALQEEGRFILGFVGEFIQTAGYKSAPTVPNETAFPAADPAPGVTFNAGQFITGVDGATTDSITIRYQGMGDGVGNPDGTIVDCLGAGIDSGQITVMTFYLDAVDNELECDVITDVQGPQPLISNVQDLQIQYGVDNTQDGRLDDYVDSVADWANVSSVRIQVLLRSEDNVAVAPQGYSFNDAIVNDPGDKRVRQAYVTTITLRN